MPLEGVLVAGRISCGGWLSLRCPIGLLSAAGGLWWLSWAGASAGEERALTLALEACPSIVLAWRNEFHSDTVSAGIDPDLDPFAVSRLG
jgi:hypothetical protein